MGKPSGETFVPLLETTTGDSDIIQEWKGIEGIMQMVCDI